MLPALGSLVAFNSGGRLGVVAEARPPAEPGNGRQLAAVPLRTVDQRDAQGHAAARVSGLAPLPAEATERPQASRRILATRLERAAAGRARLPDPLAATEPEELAQLRQRAGEPLRDEANPAALARDPALPVDLAAVVATAPHPVTPGQAIVRLGYRLYVATQLLEAQKLKDQIQAALPRGRRVDLTS
jgi:hypothetical protein